MKYISDSGGKDPLILINKYLSNRKGKGLQLLLHPIWWNSNSINPTKTINNWLLENNNILVDEIRANCKTYLD